MRAEARPSAAAAAAAIVTVFGSTGRSGQLTTGAAARCRAATSSRGSCIAHSCCTSENDSHAAAATDSCGIGPWCAPAPCVAVLRLCLATWNYIS